jgi:hypothetical protein
VKNPKQQNNMKETVNEQIKMLNEQINALKKIRNAIVHEKKMNGDEGTEESVEKKENKNE